MDSIRKLVRNIKFDYNKIMLLMLTGNIIIFSILYFTWIYNYSKTQEIILDYKLASKDISERALEEYIRELSTTDNSLMKYDRIKLFDKINNIEYEKFIEILKEVEYEPIVKYKYMSDPSNIIDKGKGNCFEITMLIMEYINNKYNIPEGILIKPIFLLEMDTPHIYIHAKNYEYEMDIDFSYENREVTIKDLVNLLYDLDRRV